jgi:hypothetical protein
LSHQDGLLRLVREVLPEEGPEVPPVLNVSQQQLLEGLMEALLAGKLDSDVFHMIFLTILEDRLD